MNPAQYAVIIHANGIGSRIVVDGITPFTFTNFSARGKKTEPIFITFVKSENKKLTLTAASGAEVTIPLAAIPVFSSSALGIRVMRFKDKKDRITCVTIK